jgi:integrase
MDNLKEIIKTNRPKLSQSSINAYASNLKNLFLKNNKDTKDINLDWFKDEKSVLEALKNMDGSKRKTYLASIIVLLNDPKLSKKLSEQMTEDAQKWAIESKEQVKTKAQSENWIDQEAVKNIFLECMKNTKFLWNKENKTADDYQALNDLVLLSLMGGIFIPVRRSLDYVAFKIKNIDKEKDNYLDKKNKTLVFNIYKTAKVYTRQEVEVPKQLYNILIKWEKINPTDYLLFDKQNKPMNSVKIRNKFNHIFGKKTSTNILRHMYVSNKYDANLKQMEDDAKAMGTSARTLQEQYIKKE